MARVYCRTALSCHSIDEAAADLVDMAITLNVAVETDFNGHPLTADIGETPKEVAHRWMQEMGLITKSSLSNQ